MFILRKACEAGRTGDYFTGEKTALELSFCKVVQIEPESVGSESSAASTRAPRYLQTFCVDAALVPPIGFCGEGS